MKIQMIEQGGRGGVFQHSVEIARQLATQGYDVTLHTATDHEDLTAPGVKYCRCVRWYRSCRPRPFRMALLVVTYVWVTLPHLVMAGRKHTVHVQGSFGSGLYALTVWAVARTSKVAIFSPHNTFSRSGSRLQSALLRWSCRHADRSVCFSEEDRRRLLSFGATSVVTMPLLQYVAEPTPDQKTRWAKDLREPDGLPVVLLLGQIRPDKGVEDILIAGSLLRTPARIVIAGADAGYSAEATRLIDELGVDARIIVDYFDISDFVAVLSAATVVVAPYQRASSSGVLSIANRIGTPSVAYPVGGLVESATFLTEAPDPRSLAVTLDRVLELNHEQLRPSSEKWSESTWVTDLYAEATITGGKS